MEVFLILSIYSTLLLPFLSNNVVAQKPSFEAIYQFGDSISDTGNDVIESRGGSGCGLTPYGQTFFRRPTGRCSDGRLIVDFFAQSFNLPLLNPYLNRAADFSHGVNFAVSGATALDTTVLAKKNITAGGTQSSLPVQLSWFKSYLSTSCGTPECKEKLGKSLFLVGEIGGNDYNAGAFGGKGPEQLRTLVPDVVNSIINVAQEVIDLGARRVVIPGNFPAGCMTIYLAAFKSSDPTAYDELGCLKNWNGLALLHNNQLQAAIKSLQQRNPNVVITYGDYYSALESLLQQAPSIGFDKDGVHKACCGASQGDYGFDGHHMCGTSGSQACPNPSLRVSWDGIHLTEHAYQYMAAQLLKTI